MSSIGQKRKRLSYDAGFKLHVVEFAEQSSNMAAERQFGVCEKQVREWQKQKLQLQQMPKTKRARRGNVASFPLMEDAVRVWVEEKRANGFIVSRMMVRLHALSLSKNPQFAAEFKDKRFVASTGWCNNFMNRHDFTLRKRTKIAQKLPKDLEAKIDSFWDYVIKQRKLHEYELGQIGNMDETPMTFDLPGCTTLNTKGEKTILVKTTGHEKTHFTVALACMADGTKLKPLIIFKRKTIPKNAKFPADIVVRPHFKGWMDEEGVRFWLNKVWNRRPGALLKKRSLLVWDMFRAHLTDPMKAEAKKLKADLAVIPGGLTSVLQPLDVCLNKPFKDRMRTMWNDWMASGSAKTTKGRPITLLFHSLGGATRANKRPCSWTTGIMNGQYTRKNGTR